MNVLNMTEFALEMRDGISSRASCMACNAVVGLFLSPLYSKDVFSMAIRTVCTSFKIQTARVCAGLVLSFEEEFEYIRKNTKLSRDEICAVVFGVDCARRQTYNLFWTVKIPDMPRGLSAGGGSSSTSSASSASSSTSATTAISSSSSSSSSSSASSGGGAPGGGGTVSAAGAEKAPPQAPHAGSETTNGANLNNNNNNNNGPPITDQAMDEAPDLFEYRKSSLAASVKDVFVGEAGQQSARQQQQQQPPPPPPPPPPPSQTGPGLISGAGPPAPAQRAGAALKAAKMLARPDYIFDDDRLLGAGSNDGDIDPFSRRPGAGGGSFVQITDIHVDPFYEPGSLNDCHEPLCCRATSGPTPPPTDKSRRAGRWGDYGNCDTPVHTLQSALSQIRERHSDAEYWLWTGDISPHDIWNISKTEASNHVRLVTKLIREYSNGLPVFPVIGNHEAHPVNSFSPPEIRGKFSMSWLYNLLADEWSDWLPKDAIRTLRVGGYYKLHVRRGFRILALNTNYCARLNPWSFYDPVDPGNQLKWLVDELLEAELNQDKVHIVGHVPPDNRECTQAWLFNFINIVDRFRDTIVAQFYGHTHRDEWRIIYSLKRPDEPIGIQYIGPSITPFTENNPAYRIWHQDKLGNIVDSETYWFNLTEANENPEREPVWRFSYSAQTHLNMTQGLTPAEWHNYVQRLQDDEELFNAFYKNFYRFSDVKTNQVCKAKCRHQMLSDLRLSHPYKTKPKPFLNNRKTSGHQSRHDNHHHNHHLHNLHHHKRFRQSVVAVVVD